MSPQHGTHACKHFAQIERLADIAVRSKLEPDDSINGVSLTGDHDDRHVAGGANPRASVNPSSRPTVRSRVTSPMPPLKGRPRPNRVAGFRDDVALALKTCP